MMYSKSRPHPKRLTLRSISFFLATLLVSIAFLDYFFKSKPKFISGTGLSSSRSPSNLKIRNPQLNLQVNLQGEMGVIPIDQEQTIYVEIQKPTCQEMKFMDFSWAWV